MEDNHPYIIKMPDEEPVPEYGLGYECFHAMKENSEKIAQYIEETGESQTYGELFDKSVKIAINLQNSDIKEDDIVCLCVRNRKYSIVPYLASLFIGRKVSAIDPEITSEENATILGKMKPKIIFVDEEYLEKIEKSLVITGINSEIVVIGKKTNGHKSFDDFLIVSDFDFKNFEPVKVDTNEKTAVIFFSSGTTGVPKGICISHLTLLARTTNLPLPTCSIFCQLNWISFSLLAFRCIRSGCPRVIMEEFDIKKFWKATEKYKIGAIFASIFQVAALVNEGLPKDLDVSCFKILVSGGSSLPEEVLLKARETLPGVLVMQGYGLTEIGGPAIVFDAMNPLHRQLQIEKPSSCGKPIKGIWYKVVDPDTEIIVRPNKTGELRLKSKYKMVGYHNMNSSEAFDSAGWLKTGDIVKYDEDHCFYVVDRIKDFIKYRCWVISSIFLEHILMTHPAVEKAAVIGIPHEEESDFPMGIVTLKEGCNADPEEIEKYVEERVMDRQRLRAGVKIIKEIPLTSTGKIQKRILRKKAMNGEL